MIQKIMYITSIAVIALYFLSCARNMSKKESGLSNDFAEMEIDSDLPDVSYYDGVTTYKYLVGELPREFVHGTLSENLAAYQMAPSGISWFTRNDRGETVGLSFVVPLSEAEDIALGKGDELKEIDIYISKCISKKTIWSF